MTARALASGLDEFRAVLKAAERDVPRETEKVMFKAGMNMKRGAQRRSSGIRHAPMYPYTIGFDVDRTDDLVSVEVGPDKDKVVGGGPHKTPGNLGAIFEYGSVNNQPIPHLGPALDDELPNAEKYLGDLGVELLT
jgi:hypothetical protein